MKSVLVKKCSVHIPIFRLAWMTVSLRWAASVAFMYIIQSELHSTQALSWELLSWSQMQILESWNSTAELTHPWQTEELNWAWLDSFIFWSRCSRHGVRKTLTVTSVRIWKVMSGVFLVFGKFKDLQARRPSCAARRPLHKINKPSTYLQDLHTWM